MAIKCIKLQMTETTLSAPTVETAVLTMTFCNVDSVPHTVDIYVYDGTLKVTMYKSFPIPASETLEFESVNKIILQANATITALSEIADKIEVMCNFKVLE